MRRRQRSGSPWSIALVSENSLVGLPSIMYDATVNGPPANPTTAVVPSSSRRTSLMASKSSGLASRGSTIRSASTARGVAHRLVDDRPDAGVDRERDAHADQRQHDVGVHHRGVDAELLDRHQRHLGAELRGAGDGEDVVRLAQRPVAGEASSSLAHEPDGGAVGGPAAGGGEHALGAGHRARVGGCHVYRG